MKTTTKLTIIMFIVFIACVAMLVKREPVEVAEPADLENNLSQADLECLVSNIYFEARGESRLGQLAVANVTLNRWRDGRFASSICGVVWQPGQFSWTLDPHLRRMTDIDAIATAVDVALAAWNGTEPNPIGKAKHFYAQKKVHPFWADKSAWKIVVDNQDRKSVV